VQIVISVNFEDVSVDDMRIAVRLLELIKESQSSREKFGFASSETNDKKDFHSQLVDEITKKLIDYYYPDRYTPSEKILWGVSLTFPAGSKNVKLRRFIENILQFEEEAADEIFGDV